MTDRYTRGWIIAAMAIAAVMALVPIASGALVAHYEFDGDLTDSAGSNDGSAVGDPTFVAGVNGTGVALDGDDYVSTAVDAGDLGIAGNADKTIMTWANVGAFNNGGLFQVGNGGTGNDGRDFSLRTLTTTNNFRAQFWGSGDFDFNSPGAANNWKHYALVNSSSNNQQAYVNGKLMGSATNTLNTHTNQNLAIGDWEGTELVGSVDETRVYTDAMTQKQVVEAMMASAGTSTRLQYEFNGNTDDSSVFTDHGTPNHSTSYTTGPAGNANGAILLDSSQQQQVTTNQTNGSLGFTGDGWTATAWIKGSDLSGDNPIIANPNESSNNNVLHLMVRNREVLLGQWSADHSSVGANLQDDVWYHLTWRYDNPSGTAGGGTQSVFIDGVQNGSTAGRSNMGGAGNEVIIGRHRSAGNSGLSYFDGAIGDVRVFTEALSDATIGALSNVNTHHTADEFAGVSLVKGYTPGVKIRVIDGGTANNAAAQSATTGGRLPGDHSTPDGGQSVYSTANFGGTVNELYPAGNNPFPSGTPGDNYSVELTGMLMIEAPGAYVFHVNSDDGFRLETGATLQNLVSELDANTCCSDTRTVVYVDKAGLLPFRILYREATGGEDLEFAVWSGDDTSTLGAIVGDTANGGVEVIASGKWKVRDVKSTGTISSLATAEALLAGSGVASETVAYYDSLNFADTGQTTDHFNPDNPFPGGQGRDGYAVEATALVWITEAGDYTFGANTDDGSKLDINGINVFTDDVNAGLHDVFGTINLAVGLHEIRYVFFENIGGSGLELFAAKGNLGSFDAAQFRLVGDVANGGLAVFQPIPAPAALPAGLALIGMLAGRRRR